MPEHPNEPILEAILLNQDKNNREVVDTLELMLEHADKNKVDSLLEAQLLLTHDSAKEIVQAIKDIPKTKIPEQKEVDLKETNKLLRELTDEIKKKEEYEIEIDSSLREKLKGDKGDKGENGKDGLNGKDGKDGRDGKDGKDGIQGPQGVPGKSLTQEDIDKIAKGLNKTKKQNFLFANSGVNSIVTGSNISINNTDPQNPVISSTGSQISKTITYNPDGSVNTVSDSLGTKTMVWLSGSLVGITGTGSYKNKTFTYSSGQLTNVTVS